MDEVKVRLKAYLTNAEFLKELDTSRGDDKMTERLGEMFLLLVARIQRKGNWKNYPKQVKDEMTSNAICDLCMSWWKFDSNKSNNPFAYFTSIVTNSFKRTVKTEKRTMTIRTVVFQQSQATTPDLYRKYMGDYADDVKQFLPKTDEEEEEV